MLELIGVGVIRFLCDKPTVLLFDAHHSLFTVPLKEEVITFRSPSTHKTLGNCKGSVLITGNWKILISFDGEVSPLEQPDVVSTLLYEGEWYWSSVIQKFYRIKGM
jgi:hypothetical protein